jgi:hypothetical protein
MAQIDIQYAARQKKASRPGINQFCTLLRWVMDRAVFALIVYAIA